MELSFSKIDTYLTCPRKFKLRYIDHIEPEEVSPALVFGSAVHGTIKHMYKRLACGQRLTPADAETAFREDWAAQCTVPIKWNGTTPEQLQDQGCAMIRAYLEANPEPLMPIAVEQEIRAPIVNLASGERLDGVGLLGILDRVEAGPRPIELKTSSQSWSQLRADLSLQFTVYGYMLAYHHEADRIDGDFEVIVKLKTPKIQRLTTRRTLHDFDRMFNIIRDVVRGMDSEIFYPNPSHMHCPWCDYIAECTAQ